MFFTTQKVNAFPFFSGDGECAHCAMFVLVTNSVSNVSVSYTLYVLDSLSVPHKYKKFIDALQRLMTVVTNSFIRVCICTHIYIYICI